MLRARFQSDPFLYGDVLYVGFSPRGDIVLVVFDDSVAAFAGREARARLPHVAALQ